MRRLSLAITILALALGFGSVVGCAAIADFPDEEQELNELNDAWINAEVHHDRAALERILDERFLVTYSSGKTLDRSAFIDRIMKAEIKPFKVLSEVVNIHGDTALVISTTTDRIVKFTWVAVKKAGRWRVISETFSRVAAPT